MSTCTPHPIPLPSPFPVPQSCTATLVLTTYNATKTITTSPPPGAPFSSVFSFVSSSLTTDLSLYGLVAGFATLPPGGGPRFHDAGCYPARYGELRGAWFLERDNREREENGGDKGGKGCGGGGVATYYSPGVCPVGWVGTGTVVRTSVGGEGQGGKEEETAATCCPPDFTVPAEVQGKGGEVPVYCESVVSTETGVWAADAGSWTTVQTGTVRAAGVEVRWREGEVGGGMDGGGGGDGRVLSAGAKAGIGVGIGIGSAAAVLGAVGVWFRVRRRRRVRKGKGKMKEEGDGLGNGEKGSLGPAGIGELEGERERQTPELPVEEKRLEMDGEGERAVEMDGRGREVRRAGAVRKDEKSGEGEKREMGTGKDGINVHEIAAELE
ncbi:hypothetical protein CONLIGDRAFT_685486 [Coniochaeta ligniaria NRRL 30616]|uniref:Uncharacterized protein n=1 Tax=Coniochaeta ligniaria NRRL 30616 TaxID=1408157 RepID=A0A1J7IAM9_9PEZI|nr:hypothetical protein CONLIGDRAFT_685486 [Coniochaeta ligniaria NRRL 30616]